LTFEFFKFVFALPELVFIFVLLLVVVTTAFVFLFVTTAVLLLFVRFALVELTTPFDSVPPHAAKASDAKINPNPKLYNLTLIIPPQSLSKKMRAFFGARQIRQVSFRRKKNITNNSGFSHIRGLVS